MENEKLLKFDFISGLFLLCCLLSSITLGLYFKYGELGYLLTFIGVGFTSISLIFQIRKKRNDSTSNNK